MRRILLVLAATAIAAAAQLGPGDGLDLTPYEINRIQPGAAAPDFTLKSVDASAVSLSGLRGKTVVLVFYRGHW